MTPFTDGIEILSPRASFLMGRGANYTSQFGEDGLIAACLELWDVPKWCFEVGAHDGVYLSNTLRLREQGWNAVLIEAEAEQYDKLRLLKSDTVATSPKRINQNTIDIVLTECGAQEEMGLGVIDIDGQDFQVWEGLRRKPQMMLVEYDHGTHEETEEAFREQANYPMILRLGRDKGYEPLARTQCNILFSLAAGKCGLPEPLP